MTILCYICILFIIFLIGFIVHLARKLQQTHPLSLEIDERKNTEKELRDSQERFRLAMDAINDGLWDLDLRTGAAYISPNNFTMLGYKPGEVSATIQTWKHLVHPDDVIATYRKYLHHVNEKQDNFITEYRLKEKNGHWKKVVIRGRIVEREQDGTPVRMIGTHNDVTAYRKAHQALRESENRFRQLIDQAADAIFVHDNIGKFVDVNISACESLGYTRDELLTMTVSDIDPLFISKNYIDNFWYPLNDSANVTFESIHQRKDKSEFPTEIRLGQIELQGQTVYLAIARDITERKIHEAERDDLIQRLENINNELKQFTYSISHDLKSPIITIKGYLGFLEEDALSGNISQLKEDIHYIKNAANRMQKMIEDLLKYSKLERMDVKTDQVRIYDTIKQALDILSAQIIQKGVQIQIDSTFPEVIGDHYRLVSLFQNLIDNAIKYIGDQPQPHIHVGVNIHDQRPVFFVKDNGMGIPKENHQKIFLLFERCSEFQDGSGVGLAIVKRIIDVHKGRIWVESDGIGTGSTFCFTLWDKSHPG